MKPKDEENRILADRIQAWSMQIDFLVTKQKAAEIAARELAQELAELRAKYHAATQQLPKRELDKAGYDMWENIGDGG